MPLEEDFDCSVDLDQSPFEHFISTGESNKSLLSECGRNKPPNSHMLKYDKYENNRYCVY
jgi:hypothetical protein